MHARLCLLSLAVLIPFTTGAAAAPMFGRPTVLNGNAATDSETDDFDYMGGVATDGSGDWMIVWSSPGYGGYVSSRSSDDGKTWSAHTASAAAVTLEGNTGGTVIAATNGPPTISRTVDFGVTWSPYVVLDTMVGSHSYAFSLAAGAGGDWVAIWGHEDRSEDKWKVVTSHSTDDGVTWSPAVILDAQARYGVEPQVATDRQGRWIATWRSGDAEQFAISTDVGITWSAPSVLGPADFVDLATNGQGTWIAVAPTSLYDATGVSVVISNDDGLTWSLPVPIVGDEAGEDHGRREEVRINFVGGVWQVIWQQTRDSLGGSIGLEGDIVGARSFDGGLTWTDPAAINATAATDGAPHSGLIAYDVRQEIACGSGTCVVAWESTDPLDDTIGIDQDIFYARSHDECPATPAAGCHIATRPGASRILIKNSYGGKDRLQWKMKSLEETLPSELGDPTLLTGYAVCLYDNVGGQLRNVFENDALAASSCAMGPCWASTASGFRYLDADGINGPARTLTLTSGAAGHAEVSVRTAGAALAPPVMPLTASPSVVGQLINTQNGECWESVFTDVSVNTETMFKARGD